jgi:hypothetical protein
MHITCRKKPLKKRTSISSNTTLRYMFAHGILESHLELASRRGTKRVRVEYIRLFKQEITEFKCMGGRH